MKRNRNLNNELHLKIKSIYGHGRAPISQLRTGADTPYATATSTCPFSTHHMFAFPINITIYSSQNFNSNICSNSCTHAGNRNF